MTKVDILIPYCGNFEYLKRAVDSVINQTSNNWRLYIIDDCYPSDQALKHYSKSSDSRIKYIRHAKNIGITNNFNFALQQSSAEFCVIMGCDDILLPNYLEKALNNINNADFYQPNVNVINENGNIYKPLGDKIKHMLRPKKSGIYGGEKLATSLCHGNWLYFPSIMWKTKTIKKFGFDNNYTIVEDLDLIFKIIINGGKLYLDNKTTFLYRRYSGSVSSKEKSIGGKRFKEEQELYTKYSKIFKDRGWQKANFASKLHISSRLHKILS